MSDEKWAKSLLTKLAKAKDKALKDERSTANYWNGDGWGGLHGVRDANEWVDDQIIQCILENAQPKGTTLRTQLAASQAECERLKRALEAATKALNVSACWIDGPEVDSSFDSPGDAVIARSALKRIKELICPTS